MVPGFLPHRSARGTSAHPRLDDSLQASRSIPPFPPYRLFSLSDLSSPFFSISSKPKIQTKAVTIHRSSSSHYPTTTSLVTVHSFLSFSYSCSCYQPHARPTDRPGAPAKKKSIHTRRTEKNISRLPFHLTASALPSFILFLLLLPSCLFSITTYQHHHFDIGAHRRSSCINVRNPRF